MIGRFLEWFIVSLLARLFPSRYRSLPRADGRHFFRQFKICSFGKEQPRGTPPWWHVSIFFQSFLLADDPSTFHIHRWRRMVSFVLSGELQEDRACGRIVHKAPCVYTMGSDVVHRAAGVAPRTWTLFVMLGCNTNRPKGGWGYFPNAAGLWRHYRPWNAVRSADVKPLV